MADFVISSKYGLSKDFPFKGCMSEPEFIRRMDRRCGGARHFSLPFKVLLAGLVIISTCNRLTKNNQI